MKTLKKLTSLFLIFILVFAFSGNCLADDSYDLNEIADNYGFKTISKNKMPSHIKPIVVESKKELESIINSIDQMKKETKTKGRIIIEKNNSLKPTAYKGSGTDYYTFKTSQRISGLGPIQTFTQWLEGKVEIDHCTYAGMIKDVKNITTYASGYSIALEYTNDPYASGFKIAKDEQSVRIWGAGDVEAYLLIDGFIKLYEYRKKISGVYEF